MKLNILGKHPNGQGDPYIIEDNGNFYVYATGSEGVHCYKSSSLTGDYEYLGIVFVMEGRKEYWAPAVIKIEDTFYMYVSNMPATSDDVHEQALLVAKSKKPEGPFVYANQLAAPFSIDAHPALNESGLYMFYSVNDYEVEKAGTRIIVDKMDNPFKLNGNPVEVVSPSIPEEIFMKDRFKKGQDWYTIEGACYFYESGIHYLLYSANCYESEFYFVNYATSDSKETDLRNIVYYKQPSADVYKPLLARNDFEEGTGHNSVINYNGEWYIVYHGREIAQSNQYVENRTMRIGKLVVENGTLKVERHK